MKRQITRTRRKQAIQTCKINKNFTPIQIQNAYTSCNTADTCHAFARNDLLHCSFLFQPDNLLEILQLLMLYITTADSLQGYKVPRVQSRELLIVRLSRFSGRSGRFHSDWGY